MRRALLLAPIAAGSLLLPSANALPTAAGGGYTCGLTATTATLRTFINPISTLHVRESGVVTGGPWFAPPDRPAATVSIRCSVIYAKEGEEPQTVAEVESLPTPGQATLVPSSVALAPFSPTTNIYVCTEITVYDDGQPPEIRRYDADGNPNNGAQCADAQPVKNEAITVYVAPPQNDGDICAYTQHNLYPPVPSGACVPWGPLG